jgi:lambda family phage portal protein
MGILDAEALALLGETADSAPVQSEMASMGGAYDAASRTDRTMALWSPALRSADQDIMPGKKTMDARSRDVIRNDAYVNAGATIRQDSIVGALFALTSKPARKVLGESNGFDEDWEEAFQEEIEEKFTLWAESPESWVDASRHNSLTEMVRLAVGIHTAGGEVLASAEWIRGYGRPYNTAIQFIDTDRLSTPPNMMFNDNIVGGVEKNKWGAAIAHHVRQAHPSDYRRAGRNMTWRRVLTRKPWGRMQMIHILEQQRPDQTRGVSEMVAALKEIHMTKNWRDVELQRAVVNATYAASIESDLPSADVFASMGGSDNPAAAMEQWATGYLGQIADYTGGAKNLSLDGVKIPHLFPGTKLNLLSAGKGGPVGQDFEKSLLRYVAAAMGVSYEQLSKDFSQTNYSSARAAMSETWKRMSSIKKVIADKFATAVFRLWLEEAINKGEIDALPAQAKTAGWLYEGQNLDALSRCSWIGASRGQIDEVKETQAAVLRMRHGLSTLEDEAARLGKDYRDLIRQQGREMRRREAEGLPSLVEDNTVNAISGEPSDAEDK